MNRAFTLAEVLITLGIIGIVAVLVLPNFIEDMAERINSNRQANIAQKITKSVELMTINGDYREIYTTEQFVEKLSKYLKIVKICYQDDIASCWPTNIIKDAKGKSFDMSKVKTGKDLHIGTDTNNVGLILADGAALIINYNPNAESMSAESTFKATNELLPVGNGKMASFAYTSTATSGIDFVMDVNGNSGPNQEADGEKYYDIRSFKLASLTQVSVCKKEEKVGGICIKDLGTKYIPINGNFYTGAEKKCEELGMEIPSSDYLKYLYRNYSDQGNLPTDGIYWAYTAPPYNSYRFSFDTSNSTSSASIYTNSSIKALCVSKQTVE